MSEYNWHEFLTADYETGILTWKPRARQHFSCNRGWKLFNTRDAGRIAGSLKPNGYRQVYLFGKLYQAHRVIYEMANGPISKGYQIDHIDRNPSNNSLSNLRQTTHRGNAINTGLRSTNTSGVKGVFWDKVLGMWRAQITQYGRQIYLGSFTDFDGAVASRKAAELLYHGSFTHNHQNHVGA